MAEVKFVIPGFEFFVRNLTVIRDFLTTGMAAESFSSLRRSLEEGLEDSCSSTVVSISMCSAAIYFERFLKLEAGVG